MEPPNVFVQAFPGPGPRIQASAGGGFDPAWSADGRTIYYLKNVFDSPSGATTLFATDIATAGALTVGTPHELFQGSLSRRVRTACALKASLAVGCIATIHPTSGGVRTRRARISAPRNSPATLAGKYACFRYHKFRYHKRVRVRILRQTIGNVGGFSLRHYREGHVYDVPPDLANYLVAQSLAMFEMRSEDRKPPGQVERRRKT
jgi:hypothetical protein